MATNQSELPARGRFGFIGRLSLLYALLAIVLVLLGARVWQATYQASEENDWVEHTQIVEAHINAVLARLGTVQTDAIGYAATGDTARLARLNTQAPLIETDLMLLVRLVADNGSQQDRARDFAKGVEAQRDLALKVVEQRRATGRLPDDVANLGVSQVRELAHMMLDEEEKLLVGRRLAADGSESLTRVLTAVAIVICLVFLAVSYWLVFGSHRCSLRARETLRHANEQLGDALAETRSVSESLLKLSQFGEVLQSCRTIDEVREGLGGALASLLPSLGGRLALISPSQNLAAVGAHWGTHALIAESVFAPEDCWALRRGQPYPLAGTGTNFVCKHVQWPNPDMPQAGYLCIPLAAQSNMNGVQTFDGDHTPSAAERRIALAAGEQLALALANLRLQDTLRTQSIRDPLTGLFNRRYLEVSLERELMRATRRNLLLAVLMLDLDNFKRFNDSHGHEAGDALLAQFAEVIRRGTRSEDIPCRYGGEEFTVILLETDGENALRRAEQIRGMVAEMSVSHRLQQLEHVTVS